MFTVESLLDASGFVPRAVCGSWTRGEVLLNNAADLAVALAYLAVPFILWRLRRRRPDLPFSWMLVVFGLFIITCGVTHVFEIILFYHPIYRAAGLVKVITAIASWAAVVALVKVSPALEALRSPHELEALNATLAKEVEQRREAEEQKEVLLRELHHRVKNNLQTVSSLLQLQQNSTKSGEDMLKESRGRVKALAMVHESLYLSADLSQVDMNNYLSRVCTSLVASLSPAIKIKVKAPVHLHADTAVPCGLIVNELVTNSAKHGQEGVSIRVSLQEKDSQLTLRVEDDGRGFQKSMNQQTPETLGLRLVTALTSQLGGQTRYENSQGAVVELTFPRRQR